MNIPVNFSPTWVNKSHHIFKDNNEYLYDIYNYFKSNKNTLIPNIEFIFRNFNIDFNLIEGIIISNCPEVNSNGLLFGSNEQHNKSLNNTFVQLRNTVYKNEEDWSLDHTLKKWSNQNIFLMNFNLTRDKELIEQYKKFSLTILDIIFNNLNIPILVLGEYTSNILIKFNLTNIIYAPSAYNDEFKDSSCLLEYNKLLKLSIKY